MTVKSAEKYKEYFDLDKVIEDIEAYLVNFDKKKFIKAFEFADKYHSTQKRKSGIPYITHPVETVKNLIKLHVDEDTLAAALLHDVPEDTTATLADVEEEFGGNVAFLVNGITKLSKVYYKHNMEGRQVESLKKLLIHSAQDPRIIIIKLADRLHNMSTLEHIDKPAKRLRISKETLEIYVPIANLLGIQGLKSELEDLCFKYIFPEDYESLKEKISDTVVRQQGVLEEMIEVIKKTLKTHRVKASVYGREKSLYSIYKKISSEHKSLDQINDRLALRVITDQKADCYTALGIIHDTFTPKPGRFKDYIAVPKVNGYKSIHTTVFGANGVLTEIQIRTTEMHIDAEYGIAAHYFYDESKTDRNHLLEDQRASWTSKILDIQKEKNSSFRFLSDLKIDLFQDRIFVFTPAGEAIDLPKDATAIDFAYAIHTEVGDHAIKAEVNNSIKPLTTTLKTGDLVNVVTSSKQRPELYWLSFAKTQAAKNKIRLALRQETLKDKVSAGYEMLQKELDRRGLGLLDDINYKKLNRVIKEKFHENFESRKDLLAAIGEAEVEAVDVANCLSEIRHTATEDIRVHLKVISKDRKGLLRDVTEILMNYDLNIISSQSYVSFLVGKAAVVATLQFKSISDLSEVCRHLEQIEGVEKVYRMFKQAKVSFNIVAIATMAIWAAHPFFISALLKMEFLKTYSFVSSLGLYLGMFMLFFTVVYLRRILHKSFPIARDMRLVWILTFLTSTLAVFVLLFELYFFQMHLNWLIIFAGIILMYAYLAFQYFNDRFPKELK
jgi:GTP diphosphokinase / guanosine-3',5'-bis(diphosphate) 3'-diphosphatase